MTKKDKELKRDIDHLINTDPVWKKLADDLAAEFTLEELKKITKVLKANNKVID